MMEEEVKIHSPAWSRSALFLSYPQLQSAAERRLPSEQRLTRLTRVANLLWETDRKLKFTVSIAAPPPQ